MSCCYGRARQEGSCVEGIQARYFGCDVLVSGHFDVDDGISALGLVRCSL
jgi:hypothetical protein